MDNPQIIYWPYNYLTTSKKRINWLLGGASAGKSWTIVQFFILEKLIKEKNIGILVLRKTKPAVRASCMRLFEYWLNKFGIAYACNKSDLIITVGTNKVFFDSVDDIEKKKSIEGINYVWMEEATEFTLKEFLRLDIGCRAKNQNGINQLFGSFNPIDPIKNKWLKDRTDNPRKAEQVMVLTYKDNPFLTQEERDVIDQLRYEDAEYDKIYRLGEWATPTNLIFTNWEIIQNYPEDPDEIVYGLDFGYNAPSALIEVAIKDNVLYIRQKIYESKMTNEELIERLKEAVPNKNKYIVADSAEPKSIREIQKAGFNCIGCSKGKDSVKRGIDIIKRKHLYVDCNSPETIEEFRGYKWKEDKSRKDENGNPIILDEPLKFKDHSMDAMRYAFGWLLDKTPAGIVFLDNKRAERPTDENISTKDLEVPKEPAEIINENEPDWVNF